MASASVSFFSFATLERLAELGFTLKRPAIIEIEKGARRVSLDEALAIAVALGVAPIHLIVPFEKEAVLNDEAAEAGIFEADVKLKVGENFVLNPIVARAWIRGTAIPPESPLDEWNRFYAVEVPPAVRHRLRRQVEYVREHAAKARFHAIDDARNELDEVAYVAFVYVLLERVRREAERLVVGEALRARRGS